MTGFRFIFLFLFASILINGRVQQLSYIEKVDPCSKDKISSKVLSNESDDEDNGLKRKRKPRCVEVTVPQIERTCFILPCTYECVPVLAEHKIYSSFTEQANCKRGPPRA